MQGLSAAIKSKKKSTRGSENASAKKSKAAKKSAAAAAAQTSSTVLPTTNAVPEENNNSKVPKLEEAATTSTTSIPTESLLQTSPTLSLKAETLSSQINSRDEVIEEYDFSDRQLKAVSGGNGDEDEENTKSCHIDSDIGVDDMLDIGIVDVSSDKHSSIEAACKQTKPSNEDEILNGTENVVTVAATAVVPEAADNNNKEIATIAISAADDNVAAGILDSKSPKDVESTKCLTQQFDFKVPATESEPLESTKNILQSCPITPSCIVDEAQYSDEHDEEPEQELLVQFLGEANRIAEARLAARRQARAEAREIRMRELERQQKEQEQNADRVFDMHNASGSAISETLTTHPARLGYGGLLNMTRATASRRSSEDSLEEEGRSLRDIKHELKDVEERFRKAMITNAQLDNDRASQTYEVKLLKDKSESMQESYAQLQREFKEKSRDCNALKRNLDRTSLELKLVQGQLSERDALIAEQGLVIVAIENADGSDAKRALVSVENANVLASVQGSLDVRLKKFSEEKHQLLAEVQKLNEQLETFKIDGKTGRGSSTNGPFGYDDDYEAQREANKIISDYKYKLQKAEQEIASLQASLARSETQVIRYKSTAEAAEKAEAELKVERRKLQREHRETLERLEEAETANNHLLKRLDKLKNAKSAILKDL